MTADAPATPHLAPQVALNPDPATPAAQGAGLNEGREALADLARRERFLDTVAESLASRRCIKLVLGKPRQAGDLVRLTARPLSLRGQDCLNLVYRHKTRDITKNPPLADGVALLRELLGSQFSHAHLFTTGDEWQLMVSKRGKIGLTHQVLAPAAAAAGQPGALEAEGDGSTASATASTVPASGHDREKHRLLTLDLPFLQDLGVTDAQHRLVPAMARKWKQINKFLEVLDHALDSAELRPADGRVNLVDFGAGKGYLTFAAYQHLKHNRGLDAQVRGVELRQDLVDICNAAAQRRGMDGLSFVCGDVRSHVPERLDVMIALHACDTATDFALHTGIRAGASVIMASPCCHKQLRPQMQDHLPAALQSLLRHGIHLGQQAEMLTDGLRALLLESQGYEAQVFEFVALEHTSKNKMILATRAALSPERCAAALAQVAQLKAFYGVGQQCLESLLAEAPPQRPDASCSLNPEPA